MVYLHKDSPNFVHKIRKARDSLLDFSTYYAFKRMIRLIITVEFAGEIEILRNILYNIFNVIYYFIKTHKLEPISNESNAYSMTKKVASF